MDSACAICDDILPASAARTEEDWVLLEITDLKKRGYSVLGAPYGGMVTVRGWKFALTERFSTVVCDPCIQRKHKEEKSAYAVKLATHLARKRVVEPVGITASYFFGSCVVAGWLWDHEFARRNPLYWIGFALAAVSALVPLFHSGSKPKEPQQNLIRNFFHELAVESKRAAFETLLNKGVAGTILHPEPQVPARERKVGLHFIAPAAALEGYAASESETGWSRIDYYAKFGPNEPGAYDNSLMQQNLVNLGFKHWGEFLASTTIGTDL